MSDLDLLTRSLARNVRHWRAERGFTLDALATRSGVSRGMLIQIEQARTNPSIATVVKIGDALGVSVTSLLDYERGPRVRVVAPEATATVWDTTGGSHGRLLAGAEAPGPLELWEWRLMPGEGNSSDPHPQGTWEILHVTVGTLTLTVDGASHRVPALQRRLRRRRPARLPQRGRGGGGVHHGGVGAGGALSLSPAPGSR
ncbi:helix-turn-helix domain-containing protein [Actinomadura keratinilytica]